MNEILIYTELTPNFEIQQVVLELANKAKNLAEKLNNATVSAVIINKNDDYSTITKTLSKNGFNKVYLIKNDEYSNYATLKYSNALSKLIQEIQPTIMLFGATKQGRDLAPRVSARLNYGLTADCTDLDINEQGQLASTRPTFGGKLMATILSKSPTQMATVRPGVFKTNPLEKERKIEIIEKIYELTPNNDPITIDFTQNTNTSKNDITNAEIIIAGGKGMKNKEGFEKLYEVAKLINAKVGATRSAVEAGWANQSIQIGQTGKTVSPKIYIACGISGAIQHTIGLNSVDTIIAINSDINAPIIKSADYYIIGDVFEILPKLTDILKGIK